jgi:hypothetical protein
VRNNHGVFASHKTAFGVWFLAVQLLFADSRVRDMITDVFRSHYLVSSGRRSFLHRREFHGLDPFAVLDIGKG